MKQVEKKINVVISDMEDFYNKFNKNKLSEELGSYIYNQSLGFQKNEHFSINFKLDKKLSEKDKDVIVDMIREYFGLGIRETLNYYKYNNLKKFFLFLLGIILICISHFVEITNEFLISEVLLIVGWVAIWEVFDNILLVETKKKFKLNCLKKLVKSRIYFE